MNTDKTINVVFFYIFVPWLVMIDLTVSLIWWENMSFSFIPIWEEIDHSFFLSRIDLKMRKWKDYSVMERAIKELGKQRAHTMAKYLSV